MATDNVVRDVGVGCKVFTKVDNIDEFPNSEDKVLVIAVVDVA